MATHGGSAQLALLVLIAAGGCLGPNPLLFQDTQTDTGTGESECSDSSEGDSDRGSETETETETDGEADTDLPSTCTNARLDGSETAIDCGGECPPCADGLDCLAPGDCESGVCDVVCQAPACDDAVHNGDELEVDCGGPCRFCEHSPLLLELDDFPSTDAYLPTVTTLDAGRFVIAHTTAAGGFVRWFDELGEPEQASLPLGSGVAVQPLVAIPLAPRGIDDRVLALASGTNLMSSSTDLFLIDQSSEGLSNEQPVYQGPSAVNFGIDMSISGTLATFVWAHDNHVWLRRLDLANAQWLDAEAIAVEPLPGLYDGRTPAVHAGPDFTLVVWSRCDAGMGSSCNIVSRRFEADAWYAAPKLASASKANHRYPRVARDAEGRFALTWAEGTTTVWAAMLDDTSMTVLGEPWTLQQTANSAILLPDVVALDDGSFAFAWPDGNDDRVHLRRFIGPGEPKLTDIGDEAPWPMATDPVGVRMSTSEGRLVVTWSARYGLLSQIQGQVLSY